MFMDLVLVRAVPQGFEFLWIFIPNRKHSLTIRENFFLLLVKLKLISTSFRLKNVCHEFESTRFWLKFVVKVEVELVVSLKLVVKNESNIENSAKMSHFGFNEEVFLNFSRTFHILFKTLNSNLLRRCIESANGICEFSKLFKNFKYLIAPIQK